MRRARGMIVVVALLLIGASEPQNVRQVTTIPVFAHFANWWTVPGSWATSGTMPIRNDNPMGGYVSANPDIIRGQNAEMEANGIVPLVSWWARDTYAGDEYLHQYLSIPGPQIGILYEAVGPGRMTQDVRGEVNFSDAKNAEMFISDMEHLQNTFFSVYPERFIRIDGRPVVFIWISHIFRGPFDETVARARERAPFFLIGSEFSSPFSPRPDLARSIRGMDAITSYGFYDRQRYGADMPQQFLEEYRFAVADWSAWILKSAPHVRIILPMGFAYDETRIPGRSGLQFRGSLSMARAYAEMVRSFAVNSCGAPIMPYAYITSYSEHAEGTAIEPSHEYGSGYLDIIRETFFSIPPVTLIERENMCTDDEGSGRR